MPSEGVSTVGRIGFSITVKATDHRTCPGSNAWDLLSVSGSKKEISIPPYKLSPGLWCFQVKQSLFLVENVFGEGLQATLVLCKGSVTPAVQLVRFAVSMARSSSVPPPVPAPMRTKPKARCEVPVLKYFWLAKEMWIHSDFPTCLLLVSDLRLKLQEQRHHVH